MEDVQKGIKKLPRNEKKGINSVPLEYIMRDVDGPGLAGQVYATEHEHLVVITPLEGEAFELDNGKVWLVLKDLILRGLAFAYFSHLDQLNMEERQSRLLGLVMRVIWQ